jgi:hypothetical protein
MNTVLTAERVEKLFRECLAPSPEGAILVQGVINTAAFRPEVIETHRDEIRALLAELPEPFQENGGGGWSFLNACDDSHGNQWTGMQQTMEHLFMLGLAICEVVELVPRELWSALPGGVPYYMVAAP